MLAWLRRLLRTDGTDHEKFMANIDEIAKRAEKSADIAATAAQRARDIDARLRLLQRQSDPRGWRRD